MSLKIAQMTQSMNKNTAKAYFRICTNFSDHIYSNDVSFFSEISKEHILSFLNPQVLKPSSFNQHRSAVFRLLSEIVDSELGAIPNLESLKRTVKAIKMSPPDKLFLKKKQLEEVRESAYILFADNEIVRERNLLIFDILMQTWMRIDEVAKIQLSDIDIVHGLIGVRGKGASSNSNGDRTISARIPIKKSLCLSLIQYVVKYRYCIENIRPDLEQNTTIKKDMPLFTSQKKCAVTVTTMKRDISNMVSSIFDDYIPKNHGPHCIRRSMATIKYRSCKDIVLVQKMLRHASPATTMQYLNIDMDELKSAFLEVDNYDAPLVSC